LNLGDAPGFYSHIPILSEKALKQLVALIQDEVEILPTIFDEGNFFIINILGVLDCIDYDKSEYKTFSSGRIMRFEKFEFIEKAIQNKHIFRLKDLPLSYPYVSDQFKNIVEKNNLQGFKFELVWSN